MSWTRKGQLCSSTEVSALNIWVRPEKHKSLVNIISLVDLNFVTPKAAVIEEVQQTGPKWVCSILYHRHLRKIYRLMARTTCLVCLISTASNCSQKDKKELKMKAHNKPLAIYIFFQYWFLVYIAIHRLARQHCLHFWWSGTPVLSSCPRVMLFLPN